MRALAVAGLTAALLTGCAAEPEDDVRALVEDITTEANERDADGVRTRVGDLLGALDDAVASGDLTDADAAVLRERALAVQAGADAIDPDVQARLEAERQAAEAQAQLEAERRAAEAEEQARAEADRKAQEEAAKDDEGKKDGGKGEDGDD